MSSIEKFSEINNCISELSKQIVNLENNVGTHNSDIQKCLSGLTNMNLEISKLVTLINGFKDILNAIEDKMDILERQQISRDVCISGVPFSVDKSVEDVFRDISDAIGFVDGINAVNNLFWAKTQKKPDPVSCPLIVNFITQRHKSSFFKQYFSMNGLTLNHIGLNLSTRNYVNDGMTKNNFSILRHAVKLKKNQPQPVFYKVQAKNGRVFVAVDNNEKRLIKNLNQLNYLYESTLKQRTQLQGVITNEAVVRVHKTRSKSSLVK